MFTTKDDNVNKTLKAQQNKYNYLTAKTAKFACNIVENK